MNDPENDGSTSRDAPRCEGHPDLPAVARCMWCGRLICESCRDWVQGRSYCTQCVEASAFYARPAPSQPEKAQRKVEPGFQNVTWSPWEALLVFVIALAVTFPVSVLIYVSLQAATISSLGRSVLTVFASSCALYSLLLLGTFVSVKLRHKRGYKDLGLTPSSVIKNTALGLVVGVPLLVGALGLGYLSQQILGPTTRDVVTQPMKEMASGQGAPIFLALLMITLIVLAPICEEIYFRGYLYPALRNRLGKQPGLVVNAIFFGLIHLDVVGFLSRALLGYGLGYIYEKRRSLTGPIVAHAFYNGMIVLLALTFSIW